MSLGGTGGPGLAGVADEPARPLRVHPEVAEAIAGGRAVVALETAVMTCGLPRTPHARAWARAADALRGDDAWPPGPRAATASPTANPTASPTASTTSADPPDAAAAGSRASVVPLNRLVASEMAAAIRAEGAVPATVAVLDGVLRVGLDPAECDRLAADPHAGKVSTATLAASLGGTRSAGTTVSATLIACRLAGIRTFATGGIGGVHRGWTVRPDISADLMELARTDATVVCAGCKSILDVPATIEALEMLGVPVIGVGTDTFPRFHAAGDDGDRLQIRRDDPSAIAALADRHQEVLGRPAGRLAVRPVPAAAAVDETVLGAATAASDAAADAAGIRGPDRTPWVLDDLAQRTDGASLAANIALLVANARLAGAIASAQARHDPGPTPSARA
jgi:pseudouridine-5'-phosphate glycosidase